MEKPRKVIFKVKFEISIYKTGKVQHAYNIVKTRSVV